MNLIRKVRVVNTQSCTVAIPTAIRQMLNIKMGDNVEFKIINGLVTIQKARKEVIKNDK